MKASVLPRYLFGSRDAILAVASSPWSLLIGALFVVSAGLAREYDGEDLFHEPWHALRPLAASLVTGTTLFLIVHTAASLRRNDVENEFPSFFVAYRSFLGLFWMTAPMAWLYAIPYERFMSPVDAISVNLWTLAAVAAWRVLLMTRVIAVIYGIGGIPAFFLVMLFADAVAFAVVSLVPTPVIDVMGGIRHTDRDALIASIAFTIATLSILTAPVWIIGALVSSAVIRPRWSVHKTAGSDPKLRGLLASAGISIGAFIPLLLVSQPEQINRRDAEKLLVAGQIEDALSIMSGKAKHEYPPHWNPPPRLGYAERLPDLDRVREAMQAERPADWIAEIYVEKIERNLKNELLPFRGWASWTDIVNQVEEYGDYDGYSGYFNTEPRHADAARFLVSHHASLTGADRNALNRLAEIAYPVEQNEVPADQVPR
ncbi:MAG: hypothetical protein ED559_06170 [Phycisphaera sp.]|nr:MAG: hypothetical protein ED559_06170 [Phycisphaera sp.]